MNVPMSHLHTKPPILRILAAAAALTLAGCIPPPPKVTAIPTTGLSLRVHIFGASASDVNDAFVAAHKNNPAFHVVNEGGDGDILVGLENDSPMCVPPTGLCSFQVGYRIRNNGGEALASATTTITARSDRCSDLCTQAINNVVVKVLEDAANAISAGVPEEAAVAKPPPKGRATISKTPPPICAIANGPRLPTGEAEGRAAQVEVLKRLGVLEQSEYDCLRKAYLSRL
jgi:hypothetical protein